MSDQRHEQFDGLAALYALGALSDRSGAAFESHMEVCRTCVDEVTALLPVSHGLLQAAPPLDPPDALRARVVEAATGQAAALAAPIHADWPADAPPASPVDAPGRRGPGLLFWLAALMLLAAAGAGGWYLAELDRRMTDLQAALDAAGARTAQTEAALATARRDAAERDAVLELVSGPDAARLELTGQPIAPRAAGRVLWTPDRRMAFLASDLPALPEGDVYQLWFVLPDGPRGAALVTPDAEGRVITMVDVPETVPLPVTTAVTIEPAGGMDAPTGDVYLLGEDGEALR